MVAAAKQPTIERFERMACEDPDNKVHGKRAFVGEDFVVRHCLQEWLGDQVCATIDSFRFEKKGNVVEHWDGLRIIPEAATRDKQNSDRHHEEATEPALTEREPHHATEQEGTPPAQEAVAALLEIVAPGSSVVAIGSLPGSYSNYTHVVDARQSDGAELRIVIRRYAVFGNYDRGEKARREFHALALARRHGIPAPRPIYLDESGATLGIPGIVTEYVSGQQVDSPAHPESRARALAAMLARIHSIPCTATTRRNLLNANAEAAWFLRNEQVPAFMQAHPCGAEVWQAAQHHWPHLAQVPPGLVHIDYWSGNILWDQDEIATVLDWEEAACGDPGIDVAYCRMDMHLSGMGHAADTFLVAYEEEAQRQVANLGFWELAATARSMFHSDGWIGESPARERFQQFVADALERAGG
jgi:aminoglycoside phosphotransferase (APT) family kinase protein